MAKHYPYLHGNDSFLRATANLKKKPMKSCFKKKSKSMVEAAAAMAIKPDVAKDVSLK